MSKLPDDFGGDAPEQTRYTNRTIVAPDPSMWADAETVMQEPPSEGARSDEEWTSRLPVEAYIAAALLLAVGVGGLAVVGAFVWVVAW